MSWRDNIFFGLHFDMHASPKDLDLNAGMNLQTLTRQLEKIKPDFVQCDCKGHPGYASYPTKVGVPAPHMHQDGLRIWRDATSSLGIPLVMHFSGVYDMIATKNHPEWGRMDYVNGELVRNTSMTCPLSPYTREYMIPQMLEIVREYDVDGFWVDGENWASAPCHCEDCVGKFKEQTGLREVPQQEDAQNYGLWLSYSRKNFENHVKLYADEVHKLKPGCTVCSNWAYTMRQPEDISIPVDYISGDFDWMWSTDRANAEARLMDTKGTKWDLMNWMFTSTGGMNHWIYKTAPAICQEASVVMACGGAFMMYDSNKRDGSIVPWHVDIMAEVARFCRMREPYCQHTQSVPQVAILHSKHHFYAHNKPLYNFAKANRQVEGALHCMLDNKYHVDILTDNDFLRRCEEYPLVIVPEQENLPNEMIEQIKLYIKNGGHCIITGTHTTAPFDEIAGVLDCGKVMGEDNGYSLAVPMDRVEHTLLGNWRKILIQDANTTQSIAPIVWGKTGNVLHEEIDSPVGVVAQYGKGSIVCIYGNIMTDYYESHYPYIRKLLKNIVTNWNMAELVECQGPLGVHVTLRKKGTLTLYNFINLNTNRPQNNNSAYVEDVPPVGPFTVKMKLDQSPKTVSMGISGEPLCWSYRDNLLNVTIQQIGIHDVLVVERQ